MKSQNNLEKVVFSKFKKDEIVDKIDKISNLLLEFSILFKNETTLYCSCNIIARTKLVFTKFRNLSIILTIFSCLRENKNRQISLF